MLCFEERSKCYNFFTCQKELQTSDNEEKKMSIKVIQTSSMKKKDSDSDINSESDSGVGSVRTGTGSENHSDSAIDSGKEASIKITKITKLNPPKVNRGKSVKRSESLMSRFSFIFPSESEKLGDLMLEEFKKNDQSNGIVMERLFRNSGLSTGNPVKNPTEAAAKKIKKKKSFKQLILGKSADAAIQLPKVEETKEAEATSDDVKEIGKSELVDSSSPDLNMNNREKKKRKKRRQQRKNIDENEDSSSLSDEPNESPVRSAVTNGSIPEQTGSKSEVQTDVQNV